MVFGLFSSKAKKQQKQEERILKRIEEAKAAFREEVAADTRQRVLRESEQALAGLKNVVFSMFLAWYETARVKMNDLFGQTLTERLTERRHEAHNAVHALVQTVAERNPRKLIEEQMLQYRQELAKKLKDEAATSFEEALRSHTTELLHVLAKPSDIVNALQKEALPTGTRFLLTAKKSKSRIYVIEQMPMVRTIRAGDKRMPGSYRSYRLAFPYVVFVVTVDNAYSTPTSLKVYFRNERLKSLQDSLFQAALTNTHPEGTVCTNIYTGHMERAPIAEKIDFIIGEFWSSRFNRDLEMSIDRTRQALPQMRTYEAWAKETAKNPQFVLSLPWCVGGVPTVEAFLNLLSQTSERSTDFERRYGALMQEVNATTTRLSEQIAETSMRLASSCEYERVAVDAISKAVKDMYLSSCAKTEQSLHSFVNALFDEIPSRDELQTSSERFKQELITAVRTRLSQMDSRYGGLS